MPSKPVVVVAYSPYPDLSIERDVLASIQAEIHHVTDLDDPDVADLLPRVDALLVTVEEVSAQLLAKMGRCRIVSRVGTGLDAIDVEAATQRGIWVTNIPDYAVEEVATHTLALLLALARRIPQLIRNSREGIWDANSVRPFYRLKGQTLGLLGFGRIGQATAAKAMGLGLKVIAHDPHVSADQMNAKGVMTADLETLLRSSDFVSLHMPLDDTTRHLIDSEALGLMKPTSFLINTARGDLIDEDALVEGIRNGQIAGAGVDVLSEEPPAPDHRLLKNDRVIVTPHIGWYSEDADREVRGRASEEVVRVLRGDRPKVPANTIDGERADQSKST